MAPKPKRVVLGITGGIAAYKSCEIIRQLTQAGHEVHVVLTKHAARFITPLTLHTLSNNPIYQDGQEGAAMGPMAHIDLARLADVVLIAPATANIIAQLAQGLANDLLSTLCLATAAPLVLAPAMNRQMFEHPATQANLEILRTRGVHLLGPDTGEQACGDLGFGRMLEPVELVRSLFLVPNLKPLWANKHILITAGPTIEAIDEVRFISNHSSGKMGFALAKLALLMGARVTLVHGPCHLTPYPGIECIAVQSADDMYNAVLSRMNEGNIDVFIGAAAVADIRPEARSPHKLKKTTFKDPMSFALNPDILATVAKQFPSVFSVGFAAETGNGASFAKQKMAHKAIDMIALNHIDKPDVGFHVDTNALTVFTPNTTHEIPLASKEQVACTLLTIMEQVYHEQH